MPYLLRGGAKHKPVTPSDATKFDAPFTSLWVGAAGAVVVTGPDNVDATFVGVPAGTMLPVIGIKVKATGTTAGSIVALFAPE